MREICLRNQRLQKVLSGITEVVYNTENLSKLLNNIEEKHDDLIKYIHPVDNDYLAEAKSNFNLIYYSFPRAVKFALVDGLRDKVLLENINKKLLRVQKTLGAQYKALAVLYPKNGYIGWHHNGNAPGYNILFSYSTDGNGYFKYYDYESDKVVYMYDNPGWNVKCGYYPNERQESDRVYWHAAETINPRLSIAFVIPNRDMWINMIEYITEGEYDKSYLSAQGTITELKSEGYI